MTPTRTTLTNAGMPSASTDRRNAPRTPKDRRAPTLQKNVSSPNAASG